jgi:hypothetical protein
MKSAVYAGNRLNVSLKHPILRVWRMPYSFKGWRKDTEGMAMMNQKKKVSNLPKKTYWHLYSLQNLEGDKLIRIVNKILKREFVVIK